MRTAMRVIPSRTSHISKVKTASARPHERLDDRGVRNGARAVLISNNSWLVGDRPRQSRSCTATDPRPRRTCPPDVSTVPHSRFTVSPGEHSNSWMVEISPGWKRASSFECSKMHGTSFGGQGPPFSLGIGGGGTAQPARTTNKNRGRVGCTITGTHCTEEPTRLPPALQSEFERHPRDCDWNCIDEAKVVRLRPLPCSQV